MNDEMPVFTSEWDSQRQRWCLTVLHPELPMKQIVAWGGPRDDADAWEATCREHVRSGCVPALRKQPRQFIARDTKGRVSADAFYDLLPVRRA